MIHTSVKTSLSGSEEKGGFFSKLPNLSEVLQGAKDGILGVFGSSEAGEQIKSDAVKSWLKENGQKIIIGFLAIALAVTALILFKKSKKSKKRR